MRFSMLEKRANKRPARQYVSDREYNPEGTGAMNGSNKTRGVVKFFNADKGYGFIRRDGAQDVFVHANELRKSGIVDLSPVETGRGLEFEVVMEQKGPKAINLTMLPQIPVSSAM